MSRTISDPTKRVVQCPDCDRPMPGSSHWVLSGDGRVLMGPFCKAHAEMRVTEARAQRVDDPNNLPDTRYPVSWWSESKGKLVTLESMHDNHLMNAYEKFGRILNYNPVTKQWSTEDNRKKSPTALFMAEEIRRRGMEVPS